MRICVVQNVSLTKHMALSTYVKNVAEALARSGNRVTALVSEGYGAHPNPRLVEVHESRTGLYTVFGNLSFVFWCVLALRRIGKEHPIHIIHCLYPSSAALAALIYRWIFSPSSRVVYDVRSPWIEMGVSRGYVRRGAGRLVRAIAYRIEKAILQLVDGVIFITEGLRNYYQKRGLESASLSIVSPSGIDTDMFQPRPKGNLREHLGLAPEDVVIGYVGGVAKTRDLEFLLDGFEALSELLDTSWSFVIIGDGDDLSRLRAESQRRGLEGVFFLGRVDHERIPQLVSDLDLGVCHLPSTTLFNASFPMKILEYLACGVPVLLSRMPAHIELTKHLSGVTIYKFDRTDFAKRAMNAARHIKIDRTNLVEYSWPHIAGKLVGFYRVLLEDSILGSKTNA